MTTMLLLRLLENIAGGGSLIISALLYGATRGVLRKGGSFSLAGADRETRRESSDSFSSALSSDSVKKMNKRSKSAWMPALSKLPENLPQPRCLAPVLLCVRDAMASFSSAPFEMIQTTSLDGSSLEGKTACSQDFSIVLAFLKCGTRSYGDSTSTCLYLWQKRFFRSALFLIRSVCLGVQFRLAQPDRIKYSAFRR